METREYWEGKIAQINDLFIILKNKPDKYKRGYVLTYGGILNAYREGDLTFDECVQKLRDLNNKDSAQQYIHCDSKSSQMNNKKNILLPILIIGWFVMLWGVFFLADYIGLNDKLWFTTPFILTAIFILVAYLVYIVYFFVWNFTED